jgi:hypothetical protein
MPYRIFATTRDGEDQEQPGSFSLLARAEVAALRLKSKHHWETVRIVDWKTKKTVAYFGNSWPPSHPHNVPRLVDAEFKLG